jgi:DNA-binding beta-propeller fold protein YncE
MKNRTTVPLVVLAVFLAATPALHAGTAYWLRGGDHIQSVGFDGTGAQSFSVGESAGGVSVDPLAAKIYWTDSTVGSLRRSNPNGTGAEDVIVFGPSGTAGDLTVDAMGQRAFWLRGGDAIQSVRTDGTDFRSFSLGASAGGVAVDTLAQKVYWTDVIAGAIDGANYDGTGKQEVLNFGPAGSAGDVAVDPINQRAFWLRGGNSIQSVKFDGTGFLSFSLGEAAGGIAVDPLTQKVYWTDSAAGSLVRASYDGTAEETILNFGPAGTAGDLATDVLVPEPASLLVAIFICMFGLRRSRERHLA